ncbi:Glucose-6-phosphate isomerase [Thiomonas sp. X19]|uniref:phosphoheptose isomerase n=1 Tax=Thiomonas sp. X19 TaxID=1050370 RepID=UPI000B6AFA43|nr:phosphoheptose isomerase [Thiomonas sp. X19]SCC93269.1 Glucose-6-phosphate isomerase [Thiomonas sp. X19]
MPLPTTIDTSGLRLEFARHGAQALATARTTLAALPHCPTDLVSNIVLNGSEGRPAWHLLSRLGAKGGDAAAQAATDFLHAEHARMADWAERLVGDGAGNAPLDIIHLGAGGSETPMLALFTALSVQQAPRCRVHWVANLDGATLDAALGAANPARTWVLINSKSFRTQEVMRNATETIRWLSSHLGAETARSRLVALTSNADLAQERFGMPAEQVFRTLPEIGGRFSVWSAHGLVLLLAFGRDTVERLHAGARAMDEHFLTTPLDRSAPGLLAGLSHAYRVRFGLPLLSIGLYGDAFSHMPLYLQQLLMESLGKSTSADGLLPVHVSGPAVISGVGTPVQHTYFQLLHQAAVPVFHEIVAVVRPWHARLPEHLALLANALGQADALWNGKDASSWQTELMAQGMPPEAAARAARHRACPGGRPSTFIWMEQLSAYHLGALLALYEHRTVVEGWLYGINPFDQWGVELGKTLAARIEHALLAQDAQGLSAETAASLHYLREQYA